MAGYKETTTRPTDTFAMSLEKFNDLNNSVDSFNAKNTWKKKGRDQILSLKQNRINFFIHTRLSDYVLHTKTV